LACGQQLLTVIIVIMLILEEGRVWGNPEGRRPRPRRRWLDNIRMDLVEVGWGDVDWIGLAQDRDSWRALVNSVLDYRVP
jgi:hypothetical protein